MSKPQTLVWAIGCGIVAVCCYAINGLALFGTAALIAAVGFGLLWLAKYRRDVNLVAEARIDHGEQGKTLASVMTSPGSSRLFVPEPLDRNN